jgi:hypothetical protein
MRILRFDSGETWDNPNARWGNPSYVLEKNDPGYLDPNPSPVTRKTYHTMSNNEIPDAERPLLARAEDCADGCAALQDTLPLKLVREADLRLILTSLKGDPGATTDARAGADLPVQAGGSGADGGQCGSAKTRTRRARPS